MTIEQLTTFIRIQRANGLTDAAIRAKLLVQGGSTEEIDNAFAKLAPTQPAPQAPDVPVAPQPIPAAPIITEPNLVSIREIKTETPAPTPPPISAPVAPAPLANTPSAVAMNLAFIPPSVEVASQPAESVTPKDSLPSIGSVFKRAKDLYRQKFWAIIGVALYPIIYVLSFLGVAMIASILLFIFARIASLNFSPTMVFLLGGLGFFLFIFYSLVIGLCAQMAVIEVVSNNSSTVKEAYKKSFSRVAGFLWLSILDSLAVLGGLLLFVVPAIFLAISFSFAFYIFVLEGEKGREALAKSRSYIKGRWWSAFVRVILPSLLLLILRVAISVICNTAGLAPQISNLINSLISFVAAPFIIAYSFVLYQDFKSTSSVSTTVLRKKGWITAWAVYGLVIGILLIGLASVFVPAVIKEYQKRRSSVEYTNESYGLTLPANWFIVASSTTHFAAAEINGNDEALTIDSKSLTSQTGDQEVTIDDLITPETANEYFSTEVKSASSLSTSTSSLGGQKAIEIQYAVNPTVGSTIERHFIQVYAVYKNIFYTLTFVYFNNPTNPIGDFNSIVSSFKFQ